MDFKRSPYAFVNEIDHSFKKILFGNIEGSAPMLMTEGLFEFWMFYSYE